MTVKRIVAGLLALVVILVAVVALALFYGATTALAPAAAVTAAFDGAAAMRFAQAQCDIGPRPPGSFKRELWTDLSRPRTGMFGTVNLRKSAKTRDAPGKSP